MSRKSVEDIFDDVESVDQYDLTLEENKNLRSLIADPSLDITHPVYQPIHDKLFFYLSSGYKDHELQGELCLNATDYSILKHKVPSELWDTYATTAHRWAGRRRARLIKTPSSADLALLQATDLTYSTKHINLDTRVDTSLSKDEEEKIARLFPSVPLQLPSP